MSEQVQRLLFIYTVQCVLGIIIAGLFYYFRRNYNRPFLGWWSIAWLAYTLSLICSMLIYLNGSGLVISTAIIFFSYLHLILIDFGIRQLKNEQRSMIMNLMVIALVLLLAIVSVVLFNDNPEAGNMRYLLRVGVKSALVGLGFVVLGIKVYRIKSFSQSFSRYFLSVAFGIYGLQLLWHSSIVVANFSGIEVNFPRTTYGLIDICSLTIIGLGMVMWMLENEHEKLERANHDLDSFMYSTSHDLRAPLASMLGLTNLGKLESSDPVAQEYFSRIETRVKKLDSIVGDILTHSKGLKQPVATEPVDVCGMVQAIFNEIRYINPRVVLNVTAINCTIRTDRFQLRIILHNLLVNAIKYQHSDETSPSITVRIHDEHIIVSDNGIGISDEALPHIFDMFYRASNQHEGSGLGLYIAREAAKRIDASITAESTPTQGSRFTVSFYS